MENNTNNIMNEEQEVIMLKMDTQPKVTLIDKIKIWAKANENELYAFGTICASVILGGIFGYKCRKRTDAKTINEFGAMYTQKLNESYNEGYHHGVEDRTKVICPEENVKYVVERFDDTNGKTYGSLDSYISDNYTLTKLVKEKED